MNLLQKISNKLASKATKKKRTEKILKIIFLAGSALFTITMLSLRIPILAQLNQLELTRLNLIQNLHNFSFGVPDPIQGFLQFIAAHLFKNHQIFAIKFPSALMLSLSIIFFAAYLYIKFRNRYLPYTYLLFASTSPLIILLSHQGYIPGLDLTFLLSLILAGHAAITKTKLRPKLKSLIFLGSCLAIGLLSLQELGLPLLILSLIFFFKSADLRYQTLAFKKIFRITAYFLIALPIILSTYVHYKNRSFWQIISGYQAVKNLISQPELSLNTFRTIFGFSSSRTLTTGTFRPDFLLIAALSLTIYEAFKNLRARRSLILIFTSALSLSIFLGGINSTILGALVAPAFTSLVLANMVNIIDLAFPVNPYPRNLAKALILSLICLLSILNIYVLTTATIRQNLPKQID
jgi:hypothetical protein